MSHRGGGGNPLTSDDDDSYPPNDDENPVENDSEEITYTYKTYYDYFIDNMDCTGVYDTDGNLTNVTISAEKKAEILSSDFTGSGTSTDPYQVNSSLGFWFMSKFVTLSNKHVELNCDVILNDETFDENGNASGGDGVVYSWEPIRTDSVAEFNGKNHTIFGLYFNDKDVDSVCLITSVKRVLNITLDNLFIRAKSGVVALCRWTTEIRNCTAKKGNLLVMGYSAVFSLGSTIVSNCCNYMNITYDTSQSETGVTEKHVCAIVYSVNADGFISDCVNYGNITSNGRCSGIVDRVSTGGIIRNCVNYGKIRTETDFRAAGIVQQMYNCSMYDCVNYGEVSAASWKSLIPDTRGYAITNYMFGKVNIVNCKNYGKYYGGFSAVGGDKGIETNILLENCYSELTPCFLMDIQLTNSNDIEVTQSTVFNINIKNCVFVNYSSSVTSLFPSINHNANLSIDGFVAKINSSNFSILTDVYSTFGMEKVTIKNMIIENQANGYTGNLLYRRKYATLSNDFFSVSSLIVINADTKQYYGSNFSGFYISWRTGKIGLKALDGVGYFQGAIDETWLGNNGFVKKN